MNKTTFFFLGYVISFIVAIIHLLFYVNDNSSFSKTTLSITIEGTIAIIAALFLSHAVLKSIKMALHDKLFD